MPRAAAGEDAVERLFPVAEPGHPRAPLHRVRAEVGMGQDGAFGAPGRAARVLQEGDVVEPRPLVLARERAVREECLPGPRALRCRRGGQLSARLAGLAHGEPEGETLRTRHRRGDVDADDVLECQVGGEVRDDVGDLVPHDREPRAVVLELVPQLARRVDRVVLDHDRTEPQRGVERHHVLRAVREHQRDPIARADTESAKALRCAVDQASQFAIRRRRAEELERGALPVPRDARRHHLGQRLRRFVDLVRHPVGIGAEPGTRRIGQGHGIHPSVPLRHDGGTAPVGMPGA
ncbi:MAG: hypothetical protein K0R81_2428 [Microbacterium sp.]|nr:hypothetical protein [Microbacterium sp.]